MRAVYLYTRCVTLLTNLLVDIESSLAVRLFREDAEVVSIWSEHH